MVNMESKKKGERLESVLWQQRQLDRSYMKCKMIVLECKIMMLDMYEVWLLNPEAFECLEEREEEREWERVNDYLRFR